MTSADDAALLALLTDDCVLTLHSDESASMHAANDSDDVLEVVDDDNLDAHDLSAFLAELPAFGLPPPAHTKKRRAHDGPKEEIAYLLQKQLTLATQLVRLKQRAAMSIDDTSDSASWQRRAVHQQHAVQRALHENARLRELLESQLKFVQALQRVLIKRPRLSLFPRRAAHDAVVGLSDREASLEALFQAQYNKLETHWVRHGLFECTDSGDAMRKINIESLAFGGTMHLNSLLGTPCSLPFMALSDILWDLMTSELAPSCQLLEEFHPQLRYVRHDMRLHDAKLPTLESRLAHRRFNEPNRVVLLTRSIVDDGLYPHTQGHLIENRATWSVISSRGPNECYLAVYVNVALPIFPADIEAMQPAAGTLTELLLQLTASNSERFGARVQDAIRNRHPDAALAPRPCLLLHRDSDTSSMLLPHPAAKNV
ncbi:hypothetical protein SPRG_12852 [Saprolegnia parasitica CBS 223.65]|uniref:START domain-containing protein n=1 Tax=Saprolegnia parasitica (strain CBS 223.65) TaxID=695850 RepID=A0A067BUN6_SAPPC|nr:hypothetical protein SPRG_12852 [Saprolegnia parasitica CBS 223.65]KDO21993.1 hypothetical protein SPRG_12852 [Saprolegnia parasitica CBS 223.65]|eukprot:XP_012207326.1 hypothetical protein SPRG_12852 [Saprolegnia parasitica CBS 223.65]